MMCLAVWRSAWEGYRQDALAGRTILPLGPVTFTRYLYRLVEFLCRPKRHLLAGLDLNGLPGCRVAAHAGFPAFHLEDAQPAHAEPRAVLQMRGDRGHEVREQGVGLFLR